MFRRFCSLFIVLLSLIISSSITYAQGNTKGTSAILVLGDSISAGYGVVNGKAWVDLIQQQLIAKQSPYFMINASISGDTSSGGVSRIPALLEKHHPKIVILELGANDTLRGFQIEQTELNLQKIINLNKQYLAKTMLVGMKIPNNYGEKYTQKIELMYQRLARANNLVFIPFLLEKFALKREFFQDDGIHPTTLAQPLISQTVAEKLFPMLN
ncbi:arylesterase [Polynucleobacter kasalickyi]|uniref:Acyl-CoA thioesterase-1 n=1 Tax=Polynucleobacter kasalickyi TaxID=1938817 RepID=A0A1W2BGS5_9BURK|nr:arylesterase [Polynucleobacter kasalickyi]SMC72185.1 acyl-CoA thioesterase-1 [Polynucleobacter kasalickyi]